MNSFVKCPSLDPGFEFGERTNRKKRQARSTSLYRVEKNLPFEVAGEDVFFMLV